MLSPLVCVTLAALALLVAGIVGGDHALRTLAAPAAPVRGLARVAAHTQPNSFIAPLVRLSSTPQTTLRWADPAEHTALYVTWREPSANEFPIIANIIDSTIIQSVRLYAFAFTLPNGDQVVGGALGESSNVGDGSETLRSNNHITVDTTTGAVVVSPTGSLSSSVCGQGRVTSTNQQVIFDLSGRISGDELAAFGALAFAPGAQTIDQLQSSCLKQSDATSIPGAAIMLSGCPPSLQDGNCDSPLSSAGATVNAFDKALINHDWATAYKLCAPDITRQYGEGGFAEMMIQQAQAQGNITAISSPTTISVEFTVGGQAFFTVQQQVTYDQGGQSSVRSLTSYYLLEDNGWLFWFSK